MQPPLHKRKKEAASKRSNTLRTAPFYYKITSSRDPQQSLNNTAVILSVAKNLLRSFTALRSVQDDITRFDCVGGWGSYLYYYIMPGIPPPIAAAAAAGSGFSGISATRLSVVNTMAAIDAAFWRAERVTLAGSTR